MADKDLYGVLGISKSAGADEIKQAYRKLAKQYHPDRFAQASEAERKNAEEKFKEINHAYEVLSDEQKRATYDQYGSEEGPQGFGGGGFSGFGGGSGFSGFEDIFNMFSGFGGGGRSSSGRTASYAEDGDDIVMSITIDFKEAAFGCERDLTYSRVESCPDCKGTGAKDGTQFRTCTKCGGRGHVTVLKNSIFGQVQQTMVCDKCRGTGKEILSACPTCGGKGMQKKQRVHHVSVPAGVDNGQRISFSHEGHAGRGGGEAGALIVNITVRPHEFFKRQGFDLILEYPLSFTQAAMGCTIRVPTLEDSVSYDIPAGTQYGAQFRIRGQGIKQLFKETRGDLYFTVTVEVPTGLSRKQKGLLSDFESSLSSDQYPKCKKFRKNIN